MCSNAPMKRNIKSELVAEVDDDVVEILPRRAVAPNGNGFSVIIRDTNELSAADTHILEPFLKHPTIAPTTNAKFSMKELPATGGWEIVIDDTSTLTHTHMRSIIEVIASRKRELRNRPQRQQALPALQIPMGARVQPVTGPQAAASVAGIFAVESLSVPRAPVNKRERPPKDPNAPKRPLGAFFCFLKESRAQLTQPGMRVTEITKAAGVAWAALSDEAKIRWHVRAVEDRERYDREFAEYCRGKRNL